MFSIRGRVVGAVARSDSTLLTISFGSRALRVTVRDTGCFALLEAEALAGEVVASRRLISIEGTLASRFCTSSIPSPSSSASETSAAFIPLPFPFRRPEFVSMAVGTRRALRMIFLPSSLPSSISSATTLRVAGVGCEALGTARGAGLTEDGTLLRFGRGIVEL